MPTPAELCNDARLIAENLLSIATIEAHTNPNLALPPNLRRASALLLDLASLVRTLCDKADAAANYSIDARLCAVERVVAALTSAKP